MQTITDSLFLMINLWWVYLLFGLLFGSFLNVVINRVPAGQSIAFPPSACPICKTPIKWFDNIPVLSWLILRAKCRSCKAPISMQYPIVEAVAGCMAVLLFLCTGVSLRLLVILPLGYILMAISVVDWKTYSIPSKLQYSLLTIALLGIILNLINPIVLNISFLQSALGGLCGFGILWLIQVIGRKIYKQEAMGGGDLWLLGFGGLLIGPYGIFWAFVLGSILAVIAYAIPSVIKLFKKKSEITILSADAQNLFNSLPAEKQRDISLDLLKMQIAFNDKKSEIKAIKECLLNELISDKTVLKYKLEGFYRFMAIDDEKSAEKILESITLDDNEIENCQIFVDVLSEDLLGYGTFEDNLQLLKKYTLKKKLNNIKDIICSKNLIIPDYSIPTLSHAIEKLNKIQDKPSKLKELLNLNRLYQFGGYTAEQLVIAQNINSLLSEMPDDVKMSVNAELAYIYYTDLFYHDYQLSMKKLQDANAKPATIEAVVNLYNLVLFRQVFFKQKLAFGPYLAMGIMLAFICGDKLSIWYLSLIEGIIAR